MEKGYYISITKTDEGLYMVGVFDAAGDNLHFYNPAPSNLTASPSLQSNVGDACRFITLLLENRGLGNSFLKDRKVQEIAKFVANLGGYLRSDK